MIDTAPPDKTRAGDHLLGRAGGLAANLPPLLAQASRLADTVMLGEHGRRKPGAGDAFWAYRPAVPGDALRAIDWRRSARSDQHFVQQKEWQAAQNVSFWVDNSAAMRFASQVNLPQKYDRAALVALAAATLLTRGGERVGLMGQAAGQNTGQNMGHGDVHLRRMAGMLAAPPATNTRNAPDGLAGLDKPGAEYGAPDMRNAVRSGHAVFLSDFLGDFAALELALLWLSDHAVRGVLVQVLDPAEEIFPYQGRVIFESMRKSLRYETRKARDLRAAYLDRLAQRKQALSELAARVGWQVHCHHTDAPEANVLLWIYHALEARFRC